MDGATQTELPCAAITPGPLGTTLPIARGRGAVSNRGHPGDEDVLVRAPVGMVSDSTTQTHSPLVAMLGGPRTGIARSVRKVLGSTREMVWSSRFATHSDPEPNATPPGRAPTGTAP